VISWSCDIGDTISAVKERREKERKKPTAVFLYIDADPKA
jgi:hypothetical protein